VATAGAAVTSAAIYELVDGIAQPPERPAFAASEPWPPEQYILQNTLVARVNAAGVNSSKGTIAAIAWGLPYFHHYIPSLAKTSSFFRAGSAYPTYLPVDLVTSKMEGRTVYAVQDARTFPSDQPPHGFGPVRLEQNDVAVLLRSDSLANVDTGFNAIFGSGSSQAGSLFRVTSIRQGFSGGGFYGQQGLPSKLALAANITGANVQARALR